MVKYSKTQYIGKMHLLFIFRKQFFLRVEMSYVYKRCNTKWRVGKCNTLFTLSSSNNEWLSSRSMREAYINFASLKTSCYSELSENEIILLEHETRDAVTHSFRFFFFCLHKDAVISGVHLFRFFPLLFT